MDALQQVNIKLFAAPGSEIRLEDAIPVFHRWIQTSALPELLIDVADYAHVPNGPGVMLIGHQANYSLDLGQGRLGLLYNRKARAEGDAGESLRSAYQSALAAAALLEREPAFAGRLRFLPDQLEIVLNDRLLYPNASATWTELEPAFSAFLQGVLGPAYEIEHARDPRERFQVYARAVAAASSMSPVR
ncbi:MAG: hypothetical protein SFV54_14460 [Bryobacteraceae bacterium]|nr:hypothetical protein [Bryobacteraceae bacterium]